MSNATTNSASDSESNKAAPSPVFVNGSTMKHVLVMTSAASVGLWAMFAVDVVDMYFITLLGEQQLVAAVGFAGTLLYFLLSLGIGLQIALGALVARAEGSGDRPGAGRFCSSALLFNATVSSVLSAIAWFQLRPLLALSTALATRSAIRAWNRFPQLREAPTMEAAENLIKKLIKKIDYLLTVIYRP